MWGKTQQSNRRPASGESLGLNEKPLTESVLLAGLIVIVCGAVVAAHWPALSSQAQSFDDHQYLYGNKLVQNPGWISARRFLIEVFEPSTVRGYYQPLTMISLMLDCAMGGGLDNLGAFHRTSLILHIFNTALVIVLLYMLFGNVWPAAMVGLLFGVHPLTVETVVCVAERKTVLASFFALWCMIIYVRYARKNDWKAYAGFVLMYILALMSKPTTVPLPVLLLLFDFWPLRRRGRWVFLEKVPLFVIAGIFAVITVISQGRTAEVSMPGEYSPVRIPLILCHNVIFYLYKIVWPAKLSAYYPYPGPLSVSNSMVLAGVIGTCILIPALLVSLRWTRALLTGWVFFFVAILPTMGIISFTYSIAADRYAYLPSVGLLLTLGWLTGELWGHFSGASLRRIGLVVVVLAAAISESVVTRWYLVHWENTESHIRHMFSMAPNSTVLFNFSGIVLHRQGKTEQAINQFYRTLELDADNRRAHNNLGILLAQRGDLDGAITHFVKVTQLDPDNDRAHHNLGQAFYSKGQISSAIKHYRESLRLMPSSPATLAGLSWVLATSRQEEFRNGTEALGLARRACELTDYRNPETLRALAAAYAETGQFMEAVEAAQKAVDLYLASGDQRRAAHTASMQQLYKGGKPYRANQ
jgi:Tfp pilus assembly protein PilF